MSVFAKAVLDIAAQVEAAETALKQAILAAAEAGDCERITALVQRWLSTPPTEIVSSMGLASCGAPEVSQGEHPGAGGGSTQ